MPARHPVCGLRGGSGLRRRGPLAPQRPSSAKSPPIGYGAGMAVAVVTDSTAYLPPDLLSVHGITVVPLAVIVNGAEGQEGLDVTPEVVAFAVSARRVTVSTSRPPPAQFVSAYRPVRDVGSPRVVPIRLSPELSGTYESAMLAAAELDGRVVGVDSRSTGLGLGFPTLAAAAAAAGGQELSAVRDAA